MTDHVSIEQELDAWLSSNWDPNRSLKSWRQMLVDAGWAAVTWPKAFYGRDFNASEAALVSRMFDERDIVPAARSGPRFLISETLLVHGSDEQKRRYLQKILTGEHAWCQLFSEPGSGSDLAGATTKAEKNGDDWIINGQKLWTTSAHHADYGFLLARTNWDVPKHQGLSYFLIDMRQKGVEVRPLRQMNGYSSFNEVFITDAHVHQSDLVGEEGDGWSIASSTLATERMAFTQKVKASRDWTRLPGSIYRAFQDEQDTELEPYKWYPQRAGRVDLIIPQAIATGQISDPLIRQEIARLLSMKEAVNFAASAAISGQATQKENAKAFGAVGKLSASLIARQAAKVHSMIAGSAGVLCGDEGAQQGLIAEILLSVPAISIAGGTDEIQKNIIAERVLGLPKEPRSDTGPFRDVKRGPT